MKTKSHFLWVGLVLGMMHGAWAQPVIIIQPESQTNVIGSTVRLSIEATGTPPLDY